jgi:hypothetical protein
MNNSVKPGSGCSGTVSAINKKGEVFYGTVKQWEPNVPHHTMHSLTLRTKKNRPTPEKH